MGLFDIFKKKGGDEFGDLGMPEAGGDFPPIDTGFPGPEMGGMPGMGPPPGRGFPQMPGSGMPQMGGAPPQQYGRPEYNVPPPIQPISIPLSGPQYGGQQPQYQQPQFDLRAVGDMVRNQVDMLSTKIDSMKATLDRINERLDYIERYLIGRR